jgi:hypothetical protein
MPCEEYETLKQDWEIKSRAEISAHDGYKGSIKKVLSERSQANSARIAAETRLVNHIRDCALCQNDGQTPWEVDHHQPFH